MVLNGHLWLYFNIVHASGAVTDEEVINIKRTVGIFTMLTEGVHYCVNFKTKKE